MRKLVGVAALGAMSLGLISLARPALAEDKVQTDVSGWPEIANAVRDLPGKLLSALPEARRHDPQVQQEVARLAMESLAVAFLNALGGDGDHPMFVPNQNLTLNFPMPNADTVYRTAQITPGASYRLTGQKGSLTLGSIVQIGAATTPNGQKIASAPSPRPTLDMATLHTNADGNFDLLLSPTRPADYKGDWWQLGDHSNSLLLRLVSADWQHDRDPTISIERLDRPARALRPDAEELAKRLRQIPATVAVLPMMFVGQSERLRAKGVVNQVQSYDLSQAGGLAGQSYYEGAFELGDDEALLMEVKAPTKCDYWSVILGDDLHRTIDWANNHSSLNNSQGRVDNDGMLRFVISGRDPGLVNWLDTAGHRAGVVQGRWLGCDSSPVPTVRKVQLGDIRSLVPANAHILTPAQREALVRERRSAVQRRALW